MLASSSQTVRNHLLNAARVLAVAGLLTCSVAMGVDPFAFGFESATITGLPNNATTGAPSGTTGQTFSYTFVSGNNLQFSSTDTDDAGTGSVPDYYKSELFGWNLDGYVTRNNTTPQWGSFLSNYVGNGAADGIDYPGNTNAGRRSELGEGFNINRGYSPAQGNLLKAPGLGDQFMDTWGNAGGGVAQVSFDFVASISTASRITLALGGRDSGSDTSRAFYRLLAVAKDASFQTINGSSSDGLAMEYYTNVGSVLTQVTMTTNDVGVVHSGWEYYQLNYNVIAGARYRLQLLVPDEINYDIAVNEAGKSYLIVPGVQVIPETSTAVWIGALSLGGLALRRRLRL